MGKKENDKCKEVLNLLLRGSFIPEEQISELRSYERTGQYPQIKDRARYMQRM